MALIWIMSETIFLQNIKISGPVPQQHAAAAVGHAVPAQTAPTGGFVALHLLLRIVQVGLQLPIGAVGGMEQLLRAIENALGQKCHHVVLTLPYSMGGMVDTLHSNAKVHTVDYTAEGIVVDTVVDEILYGRLKDYITKEC